MPAFLSLEHAARYAHLWALVSQHWPQVLRRVGGYNDQAAAGLVFIRDARGPGAAGDDVGFRLVRNDP